MARQVVEVDGALRIVANDDPVPAELRTWAVLRTRVVDELTHKPPPVPITLTTSMRGARPRVTDGGICGLVARPADIVASLMTSGGFTARVAAPGYLDRDLTPAIETARRSLNTQGIAGTTTLDVLPADPDPRQQFRPGRGVAVERATPTASEFITTVGTPAAPPNATDVPLTGRLDVLRPAGTRVAGIPVVLPEQPLHRDGTVRIHGTVQRRTGPASVAAAVGASIAIRGVWWDYPSSMTGPALAPDVCAVQPTIRTWHDVSSSVDMCTLTPVNVPTTLDTFAASGSLEVRVRTAGALNVGGGDLVRIGDPLTTEHEVVVTDAVDAPAGYLAPVRVRLRTPTGFIHRAGEPVQRVQESAVVPVGSVSREALPGDAVLFASSLPSLPTTATIVVDRLTPDAVYYRATQVPSTPNGLVFSHLVPIDGAGSFSWPPIARIAQVRVVASLPPYAPQQLDVALDYGGDTSLAIVLT
jgi:hypothetical protein